MLMSPDPGSSVGGGGLDVHLCKLQNPIFLHSSPFWHFWKQNNCSKNNKIKQFGFSVSVFTWHHYCGDIGREKQRYFSHVGRYSCESWNVYAKSFLLPVNGPISPLVMWSVQGGGGYKESVRIDNYRTLFFFWCSNNGKNWRHDTTGRVDLLCGNLHVS